MAFLTRQCIWLLVFLCLHPVAVAQLSYFDERSGVEILFPSSLNIFPAQWSARKVNPDIRPVLPEEVTRLEDLLSQALLKYPAKVLDDNLTKVFVLKSMTFYGLPYGGTNYGHSVYLSDDTDNPYFTDQYIEMVFHHEFSSILMRYHPAYFDRAKWISLNPPAFRYGKGGAEAILNGQSSMEIDPELAEKGFLSKYSTASLEEDVNVFAQNLFTGGREFWRLVDLNDIIGEKTRMLILFYHRINPAFTESYFRSFYYNSTAQR